MEKVTKSEHCMNCKECCMFEKYEVSFSPLFTEEELKKIPHDKDMFDKKEDVFQIRLKEYGDKFICPFLNTDDWCCNIYENRPFDCKIYPFIIMKDKEKTKIMLGHFHEACNSLKKQSKDEFQEHISRLKEKFQSEEYVSFFKKNPGLIWDYDEDADEDVELEKLSEVIL